jgi:hypothetical protein
MRTLVEDGYVILESMRTFRTVQSGLRAFFADPVEIAAFPQGFLPGIVTTRAKLTHFRIEGGLRACRNGTPSPWFGLSRAESLACKAWTFSFAISRIS